MAAQPPISPLQETKTPVDQPPQQRQYQPEQPPDQSVRHQTRFRRFIIIALVALLLFLTAFLRLLSYSMTRRMQDVITLPPPDEYIVLPSFEATSSWKSFTASAVNLEFRLPAALSRFGDVEERAWSVEPFSGSELCISLDQLLTYAKRQCDFDTFGIFAISSDYSVGRGAGFGDFQGFRRYKGKFLGKITTKEFEIPPEVAQEMLNSHGVRMLKVIGRTDPNGDDFPTPGEGWIGAIVATPDVTFPALNVQLKLGNDLTEETFDQILSTLRFLDGTSRPSENQLVYITYIGGLCPDGVCKAERIILKDGSSSEPNTIQVKSGNLTTLTNLINATDFDKIRENIFTETCPTAYDGQEVTYTFYTSHGPEVIASCQTQIDENHPLFKQLNVILTQ